MSAHFDRALVLFEQQRHALAEGELLQELAAEPNNPMAHALLALCLCQRERYQEATEAAHAAIHLAPDTPFTHYALANVLQSRNHLPEAEEAVMEAIRLDPEDADYRGMLAGIRYGRENWQAALEAAEEGLAVDPEHVSCNNLRAMALVKLGRHAEAGATIDAALARGPEVALTHANQGWALLEQGMPYKAMEHFQEALRLDPEMDWARAGIVEAMKARNWIYRLLLWYFLWMAKLSGRARWMVLIGAVVGARIVREVADRNPALAPWLQPLLIAYFVFVVLTWLGSALFNLLLRLSRFGRLALSREQIVASNWIGGFLLLALVALGFWLATGEIWAMLAAGYCGLLIIPIAATFQCEAGWPRWCMVAYTVVLALLPLAGVAALVLSPRLKEPALLAVQGFVLGAFLSTWAGNIFGMVRPRR